MVSYLCCGSWQVLCVIKSVKPNGIVWSPFLICLFVFNHTPLFVIKRASKINRKISKRGELSITPSRITPFSTSLFAPQLRVWWTYIKKRKSLELDGEEKRGGIHTNKSSSLSKCLDKIFKFVKLVLRKLLFLEIKFTHVCHPTLPLEILAFHAIIHQISPYWAAVGLIAINAVFFQIFCLLLTLKANGADLFLLYVCLAQPVAYLFSCAFFWLTSTPKNTLVVLLV